MQTLYQLLGLIGAGLIVWLLYSRIKNNPTVFSRENMGKSFTTLGVLGIILILFVVCLVYLARM